MVLQGTSQKRHGYREHKGQNCETNHMERVVSSVAYSLFPCLLLLAKGRKCGRNSITLDLCIFPWKCGNLKQNNAKKRELWNPSTMAIHKNVHVMKKAELPIESWLYLAKKEKKVHSK
uniref:Uncharacterized protein n=1 Tax=Micrurus corallinus TaxID=54390 RepID=A0A2D4GXV8_MICCO